MSSVTRRDMSARVECRALPGTSPTKCGLPGRRAHASHIGCKFSNKQRRCAERAEDLCVPTSPLLPIGPVLAAFSVLAQRVFAFLFTIGRLENSCDSHAWRNNKNPGSRLCTGSVWKNRSRRLISVY